MNLRLLSAIMLCGGALCHGQGCNDNIWTKPTSGYWEEGYWSCGHLPAAADVISFTNAGWKALAIGPGTTANFPNSLSVSFFAIGAPEGSSNTLLLNYAGTHVALSAQSLWLNPNASVVSYYSALNANYASLYSTALFAEGSSLQAGFLGTWSGLTLSNSTMTINTGLHVYPNSTVDQWDGASDLQALILDGASAFNLHGGAFRAHELCLEAYPDFPDGFVTNGVGTFTQAGGDATADSFRLGNLNSSCSSGQGRYVLQDGTFYSPQYQFYHGTFAQAGGTNTIGFLTFPEPPPMLFAGSTAGTYELSGGTLLSGNLTLGVPGLAGEKDFTHDGYGSFCQSGGLHINSDGITIPGFLMSAFQSYDQFPHCAGAYSLSAGILISSNLDAGFGGYSQSGGANFTTSLRVGGFSRLTGGELITSNSTIHGYASNGYRPCTPSLAFTQTNGTHYVQNKLLVDHLAIYDFRGGALDAQDIQLDQNAVLQCQSGIISNWGNFILSGAVFRAGTESHYLGKLQGAAANYQFCPATNSTLDVSGPAGSFLRFRDSRDASLPRVHIVNWQPWTAGGSSHHIYFGTNAQALSPDQLQLLIFVNPLGWLPGDYPARILSNGEIVPAQPPPLTATRLGSGLLLSWPGDYQLLTATNVLGPYSAISAAASPFTNLSAGPERYFRLSSGPSQAASEGLTSQP